MNSMPMQNRVIALSRAKQSRIPKISRNQVEEAVESYLQSGGKINKLPPGDIFTLTNLESLYENNDTIRSEASRYRNKKSS